MCVFLAPLFAPLTALATYALVSAVMRRRSTALLAAALVSVSGGGGGVATGAVLAMRPTHSLAHMD